MKIDRELIKGCSEIAVLRVLCDAPLYGYKLARELDRRSSGVLALGHGTLYPLLYNLENKGWIEAAWEPSADGPSRKVYAITATGRARLVETSSQWASLVSAMSRLFAGGSQETTVTE